jgi:hypothetical protein
MDPAPTDDLILEAIEDDPEHVGALIAKTVRRLQAEGRYTPIQIAAAIPDLLAEIEKQVARRHSTLH